MQRIPLWMSKVPPSVAGPPKLLIYADVQTCTIPMTHRNGQVQLELDAWNNYCVHVYTWCRPDSTAWNQRP